MPRTPFLEGGLPLLVATLLLTLSVSAFPVAAAEEDAACGAEGDEARLRFTQHAPTGHIKQFTPEIRVTYSAPCGLDAESVVVTLDDARLAADVSEKAVTARVPEALHAGPHVARVTARDVNGATAHVEWPFVLLPSSLPGERHFVMLPQDVRARTPRDVPLDDPGLHLAHAWLTPDPSDVLNLTFTVARLHTLPPDVIAPPADPILLLDFHTRALLREPATGALRVVSGSDDPVLRFSVTRALLESRDVRPAQVQALEFRTGAWHVMPPTEGVTNATHVAFNATVTGRGPLAVVFDTQPPIVQALAPTDRAFFSTPPQVRAAVRDNVALAFAQVIVDDRIANTFRRAPGPVLAQDLVDFALDEGRHTVEVRAQDHALNNASESWTFILDRTPPTFPRFATRFPDSENDVLRVVVDYVDTLSGVDAATARVRLDDVDVTGEAVVTRDGITLVPARALAPGGHTVSVTVSDRAGNVAEVEHAFTVPAQTPGPGLAGLALAALAAIGIARVTRRP